MQLLLHAFYYMQGCNVCGQIDQKQFAYQRENLLCYCFVNIRTKHSFRPVRKPGGAWQLYFVVISNNEILLNGVNESFRYIFYCYYNYSTKCASRGTFILLICWVKYLTFLREILFIHSGDNISHSKINNNIFLQIRNALLNNDHTDIFRFKVKKKFRNQLNHHYNTISYLIQIQFICIYIKWQTLELNKHRKWNLIYQTPEACRPCIYR